MANTRKPISKKIRFEVFKRDSFKCQYCGEAAPDVILEVDHIDPVSKGGSNEMVNFITSCRSCNSGKSDRRLDDNTTLTKQRAQLEEINERREQIELMMKWRSAMKSIQEIEVDKAAELWESHSLGFPLSDHGKKECAKLIKKYGLVSVLDAIETASDSYIVINSETNKATKESANNAWQKVAGILVMRSLPESEKELHYIKGILRSRLSYIPPDIIRHLKAALDAGLSTEDMKIESRITRSWTKYREYLNNYGA